jgi:hypothetical protein
MDLTPKTFLWISLAAHVALGAAVYARASRAPESATATTSPREPETLLSGDTFEVPVELPTQDPETLPVAAVETKTTTEPIRAPSLRSTSSHADPGGARTGGGESTAGTVYGASGDRASVDLSTAFTRGFPQAASADPAWALAPLGPAGEATVVIEIDESGVMVSSIIEGAPSPALRAGLTRTLALLRARAFTASRPVTRLHVTGYVSADEVHDGLHGEAFAVSGSFDGSVGSAFFALPIGRRVDLTVRQARVEHKPSE